MAGSVLMLIAILVLGISAGTFDLEAIAKDNGAFAANALLFLAFAIAFAIKVPVFPFHTWLPDAHVEAPTAGSVILAAVLLKMGSYGLIRYNLQLFPEASAAFAPLMIALAVIGILYGALVAFAQSDAKKLVAYSSVSHMGYILLGTFALNQIGIQGALLQMVNHGLSTGGLFLIIGFLYERRHTREMNKFGGLWARMPLYGTLALILALSSAGLPALNGFVGEFVILQGAFLASPLAAAFAAVGMVLSAVYLLTMFQKVFLGESRDSANDALRDVNWREVAAVAPLIVLCFVIGLQAAPFLDLMGSSVAGLLAAAGVAGR
jgi:NADH-quinone oxidoreductase subunit M